MTETTQKFTVDLLKTRLDKYLVSQLPSLSRAVLQKSIEAGMVTVNGKVVTQPHCAVRHNDLVVYTPVAKAVVAPTGLSLKTLYNEHGLLIIDKPAGLAVHPGAGLKADSLAEALLYQFKDISVVGEEGRHGIVHRLDKDTSGVMLVALTPEMYAHLKDGFQRRKIKKQYLALVSGRLDKPHAIINNPIGKSKTDFRKYTTKNMLRSKEAVTEYWVLEQFDEYALIKVQLHTGRTHQIRVHLGSLGHPLVGDRLYGSKTISLPGLSRQFLHAYKIEVQLPDGTWIEAESQLSPDLRQVLKALGSKKVNAL